VITNVTAKPVTFLYRTNHPWLYCSLSHAGP